MPLARLIRPVVSARAALSAVLLAFLSSSAWAAGDIVAGRAAFAKCASCHQVGPSARAGFGPQLQRVIGRRAGSTADFKYSPAMANAGFVWTEDKLRAFMKAPGDVVPGNKMRFWGIGSDRQIDDILAYLRSTTQ
ncbi:cytochrome c family protein [Herbaspirillum sp. WKF16]|uniref:c-type cytochrome n=1 Tax=Herbaspirillum sp. WKF16 TaxID=3028312 RepID=UPI0023AA0105|nr:cytochrome c family protein [Herbaspirillum sp. WKF16]WDZ95991.1 cytochrome c family protein [Herbaspirillum sp. WKF16]